MASIGLRMHFKAAVFFSPFLAAITNHIMLGSHHSLLIFTKALVSIKDAVAVRRGHRMNSWGTPIAFAWPFKTFSKLLLKLHSFSTNRVFWAFCSLALNRCTSVDDSLLRDMMFLKGINNMHILKAEYFLTVRIIVQVTKRKHNLKRTDLLQKQFEQLSYEEFPGRCCSEVWWKE